MDTDLSFVLGIIMLGFAIPSIISAFSESRAPRTAALMVIVGGALIGYALYQRPNTYTIEGIPDAFVRVVGRYIN